MIILFTLSLLIILLLSKTLIKKSPKNLPPSPPSLPILGHLHLFTKPLHQTLTSLASRLGPLVSLRFGSRPVLLVSSPHLAHLFLTTTRNHPSQLSSLSSATNIYADETRRLLRGLRRDSDAAAAEWSVNGSVKVEMKGRLFAMGVDAVMRIVGGKRCYGEEEWREGVEELFGLGRVFRVGDWASWLGWVDLVEVGRRVTRFRERVGLLLEGIIEENRRRRNEETLIGILLGLQRNDPEKYCDSYIKDIVLGYIISGTETISNTTEWALSLLLNNPDKLKKAITEIDDVIGRRRLVTESDLPNLPYLRCIVSETLRLYPAAPLIVAHESSSGCEIDGYDVPRGTMIIVNVYSIHRDPEVWADPPEFRPERLREEGGVAMPFGLGRRRCPADGLAGRVLGQLVGSLIQCFEWERVGSEEVSMVEGVSFTLPKAVPLVAVCTPRPGLDEMMERI